MKERRAFAEIATFQFFECFCDVALLALLTLFAVKEVGLSDKEAIVLFSGFSALVYCTATLGGLIADRILGIKRTLKLGALILLISYFLLAFRDYFNISVFFPLALIIAGSMCFKSASATLIGLIGDKKNKDIYYTLYYVVINLAAGASAVICPIVATHYGFNRVFILAGIFMTVGLLNFSFFSKELKNYNTSSDMQPLKRKTVSLTLSLIAIIAVAAFLLLRHLEVLDIIVYITVACAILFFCNLMRKEPLPDQRSIWIILVTFMSVTCFFAIYFQMGGALTIYALRNVEHTLFGFTIPVASFQALNPIFILILSPILASFYAKENNQGISSLLKIGFGLILSAIACFTVIVANFFAEDGIVNSHFLVIQYLIQSAAELIVSALRFSIAYSFSPKRYKSYTLGLIMMANAFGAILSGDLAKSAFSTEHLSNSATENLPLFTHLFSTLGMIVGLAGITVLIIYPWLKNAKGENLIAVEMKTY